jgi:EAL domain-containing protein (putative c-di-GMP-specific phosphodiesterase class I)
VAEGIEDRNQYMQLKNMKCKLGQGYLFAKPLDETSASALIMEGLCGGRIGTDWVESDE